MLLQFRTLFFLGNCKIFIEWIEGDGNIFMFVFWLYWNACGIWGYFWKFILQIMNRRKIYYIITDRRVLIWCGNRCVVWKYEHITYLKRKINADNTGTIFFVPAPTELKWKDWSRNIKREYTVELAAIKDAERVYRIIKKQKDLRSGEP